MAISIDGILPDNPNYFKPNNDDYRIRQRGSVHPGEWRIRRHPGSGGPHGRFDAGD